MHQTAPHSSQPKLRILVVEDHYLLRKLFFEAFHDLYNVRMASNADEGWDLCATYMPQIVFLDINLPDASGHTLARRIKEHHPETFVVMATASDYPEDAKTAIQNNVDGFIIKPFDKKKIDVYIDRYQKTHSRES